MLAFLLVANLYSCQYNTKGNIDLEPTDKTPKWYDDGFDIEKSSSRYKCNFL
jgi:hypothetical protein